MAVVGNFQRRGQLLDREIFLTRPSIDLRQVNYESHPIDCILRHRQQFAGAPAFANCLLLSSQACVNQAQKTQCRRKVRLFFKNPFYFAACHGKGRSRFGVVTLPTSNDALPIGVWIDDTVVEDAVVRIISEQASSGAGGSFAQGEHRVVNVRRNGRVLSD